MCNELFKPIPWYKYYECSNLWNIRSIDRKIIYWENKIWFRKWKQLKQFDRNWYLHIRLWAKSKTFKVHRLVLLTFIWDSNLIVNHINWIKTDNRLENLEYTTYSWNLKHSYDILKRKKIGLFWEKNKKSKKVNQYDLQWNFIKTWDSWHIASRNLNISQVNISKCCRWKQNTCGWYKWKFKF